jgi:hypothetical protein
MRRHSWASIDPQAFSQARQRPGAVLTSLPISEVRSQAPDASGGRFLTDCRPVLQVCLAGFLAGSCGSWSSGC